MNLNEHLIRIKSIMGIISEVSGGSNRLSKEDFIERSQELHVNPDGTPKYDYSLVDWVDTNNKVKVICPKHTEQQKKLDGKEYFEILPNKHLQGQGCRFCYLESKQKHSDKELEDAAKNYTSTNEFKKMSPSEFNASIKRNKTNPGFYNRITSHFVANVSESAGEKIVAKILIDNGLIPAQCIDKKCEERQKKFDGCVSIKKKKYCKPLQFDFYIPSINTVVEYDGDQHFIPSRKYGDEKFIDTVVNDTIKNKYCNDNGINLIRIPYNMKGESIAGELLDALNNGESFKLLGNYPTKGWNSQDIQSEYPEVYDILSKNELIFESELDNFVVNYLNGSMDKYSVGKWDSFIVIQKAEVDDDDIEDSIVLEFDSFDDRLYISKEYIRDFLTWFPIDVEKCKKMIKDWFEERFEVKIKKVDTNYGEYFR